MRVSVSLTACDWVEVSYKDDQQFERLQVIGCNALTEKLWSLKNSHGKDPKNWPQPLGTGHEDLLIRELILKCQGQWQLPYQEDEICHCRSIPTKNVTEAILQGAHTAEDVSRLTNASTSCGTCRFDVDRLLNYYLAKS